MLNSQSQSKVKFSPFQKGPVVNLKMYSPPHIRSPAETRNNTFASIPRQDSQLESQQSRSGGSEMMNTLTGLKSHGASPIDLKKHGLHNRSNSRTANKKKEDGGTPAGFSNLIKRDFFNRDGPKRQPMTLLQDDSQSQFQQQPILRIKGKKGTSTSIMKQNPTMKMTSTNLPGMQLKMTS